MDVCMAYVIVADALTVGNILIKVIAIGLIALHMVIGAGGRRSGCCIHGCGGGVPKAPGV